MAAAHVFAYRRALHVTIVAAHYPTLLRLSQVRQFASRPDDVDLYKLLGLHRKCSQADVKAAFYFHAKQVHPDRVGAAGKGRARAAEETFLRVAAAYEVLSNPRRRQLYDAELDAFLSSIKSQSAPPSSEQNQGAPKWQDPFSHTREPGGADVDADVASWVRHYRQLVSKAVHGREELESFQEASWGAEAFPGAAKSIRSIRRQLRGDFRTALRTAYFGPPLGEEVIEGTALPPCFEGEERSPEGAEGIDLMHIVSGRTLLGIVREKVAKLIGSSRGEGGEGKEAGCGVRGSFVGGRFSTLEFELYGSVVACAHRRLVSARHLKTDGPASWQVLGGAEDAEEDEKVDCIDIFLAREDDERAGGRGGPPQGHEGPLANSNLSTENKQKAESAGVRTDAREEGFRDGQVFHHDREIGAETEEADGDPLGAWPSRADGGHIADNSSPPLLLGRILNLGGALQGARECPVFGPEGEHSHTLVHHKTPLVRHMAFYRRDGVRQPCECRCRRATLLPSQFWLFEPRSGDHAWGSWYFETFAEDVKWQSSVNPYAAMFGGRGNRRKDWAAATTSPMTVGPRFERLHPAVYILAASYQSLDEEVARQKSSPRTLTVRIKEEVSNLWCRVFGERA